MCPPRRSCQSQGGCHCQDVPGHGLNTRSLRMLPHKCESAPPPASLGMPAARFVVKTSDEGGRKVFINMCGHAKVAAPGNWANGVPEEIQSALDNLDNLSQQEVRRQYDGGCRATQWLAQVGSSGPGISFIDS